ncbi:hypothetical protein [Agrobacterium tumefaciens]|uniref:hypothetical protein n=1 Tax=Agrobacterium tumefaciens TaxID=358 RepID=UPI001575D6B9|nr:hypothetical protein [Agrobacterium tumefaciens]NTZ89289.1 hypothetical protein [Agrobacterium tumefaciens]
MPDFLLVSLHFCAVFFDTDLCGWREYAGAVGKSRDSGEPGGQGVGINRPVFYSDVAAPRIRESFESEGELIETDFEAAVADKVVQATTTDKHIARHGNTMGLGERTVVKAAHCRSRLQLRESEVESA